MTGEITLRGRVLAIGGLKEKTMAAYLAGVKQVIIPFDNKKDLDEIDAEARENLIFIPCKTADEVLSHALARSVAAQKSFVNTQPSSEANNIEADYASARVEARI